MKKISTLSKRVAILLSLTLLVSFHVRADNLIWTGDGGAGDWTDPNNFFDVEVGSEGAEAPAPSDNVEIPAVIPGLPAVFTGVNSVDINDLTIDAGATLSLNNTAIIFVFGIFSNSGIVSLDHSEIFVTAFNAVNSGTITVANGANLYINNGPSFTNSGNIDIDGSSYVLLTGDLINTGSFTNSDGTTPTPGGSGVSGIEMEAISDVTISGGGYIDNIEVDNCDVCTTSIGTSVGDTLHIRNMLLPEFSTFVTNNRLVLSPVVTSSSSALSGMGMIGPIGGSVSLTGGVTVSQYIPGLRAYRFYSHPFTTPISLAQIENCIDITGTGGRANGFTTTETNNPSAWWFNIAKGNDSDADGVHADPGWAPFTNATSTTDTNAFNQYEGIYLFVRGAQGEGLDGMSYTPSPAVINIYGDAVNTGDQAITLHTGPLSTFNMVGNPYPCTIDLGNALSGAGNSANLSSLAYFVWDPYMATAGAFITQAIDGSHHYLQPNTAFQVEAIADGVTLTFNEGDKVATSGIDNELLRQTATNKAQYVTLNVYDASNHLYDIFHLQLRSDATNAKEKADAGKPTNTDLNLYSIASTGERLSIDARPYVAGDVIPLGINAIKPQTFVIRADDYNVPAGATLSLHDKYKGIYKQLQKGEEYSFDITTVPASQGNGRFELQMGDVSAAVAKAATSLTVTPNPATEEINVAYNVQVSDNASIRISNMLGQQVYTTSLGTVQNGTVTVPLQDIPAGIYMAELICGSKITTQRFVKQ